MEISLPWLVVVRFDIGAKKFLLFRVYGPYNDLVDGEVYRMSEQSKHLNDIIAKQHGSTAVMVVFFDIIKYSLRKSVMQERVINGFNGVLQSACDDTSKTYSTEHKNQTSIFRRILLKFQPATVLPLSFRFKVSKISICILPVAY
jgi:hypothetical protein